MSYNCLHFCWQNLLWSSYFLICFSSIWQAVGVKEKNKTKHKANTFYLTIPFRCSVFKTWCSICVIHFFCQKCMYVIKFSQLHIWHLPEHSDEKKHSLSKIFSNENQKRLQSHSKWTNSKSNCIEVWKTHSIVEDRSLWGVLET